MKTKLRTLLLIGFSSILTVTLNAQTSKSCGQCHKAVSVYSKVGDYCPHCHVRWGYENTKTTTTSSYDYNDYPSYSTEEYTYTLSAYVSTQHPWVAAIFCFEQSVLFLPWTEWSAGRIVSKDTFKTTQASVRCALSLLNSPWTEWSAPAECIEGHISITAGSLPSNSTHQ